MNWVKIEENKHVLKNRKRNRSFLNQTIVDESFGQHFICKKKRSQCSENSKKNYFFKFIFVFINCLIINFENVFGFWYFFGFDKSLNTLTLILNIKYFKIRNKSILIFLMRKCRSYLLHFEYLLEMDTYKRVIPSDQIIVISSNQIRE